MGRLKDLLEANDTYTQENPYGNDFVLIFNIASDSETLTIPCQNRGTFNATIDWGDGSESTITAYNDADLAHTYTLSGEYKVRISGSFPNIYFNNGGDKDKLIEIKNFGDTGFSILNYAFYGCSNLKSVTSYIANTSSVASMYFMFQGCPSLTSLDVSGFDTSSVTYIGYMFYGCSSLTSLDVSGFDTSSVTNMGYMFNGCPSLTSLDVSGFDTSSVANMRAMFTNCPLLASLDVSGFDTSSVTNMGYMFQGCPSLTSLDVSSFNTSSVTDMSYMFNNCSSLTDLDPSGFNIEALDGTADLTNFATNVTIPTANYDAMLINWAAQTVFSGMTPNFGNSKYTAGGAAEAARTSLINDDGWTIYDAGPA